MKTDAQNEAKNIAAYEKGCIAGKAFDLNNPEFVTQAERLAFRAGWMYGLRTKNDAEQGVKA